MKEQLEKLSDDALKAVLHDAQAILKQRELERRKVGEAEIRKIAAVIGVNVEFREPKRKGRPPKNDETKTQRTA